MTLNGALAGMVSQCAGCDGFMPWAALVVGMFGGLAFFGTHEIMLKCKLDDPLDAVGVHGGGGKLIKFEFIIEVLIDRKPFQALLGSFANLSLCLDLESFGWETLWTHGTN